MPGLRLVVAVVALAAGAIGTAGWAVLLGLGIWKLAGLAL